MRSCLEYSPGASSGPNGPSSPTGCGFRVAAYLDPMEAFGLDDITAADDVVAVVLTVGWHERQAHLFAKRTGAPVFVPAEDTCMIETLESFLTFSDGAELPLGLRAIGVPGLTRGEQALLVPCHGGTLVVGDARHHREMGSG